MTGFVPVMWAVWGVLVLIMLALKIYAGRLSRDEDDQLVLRFGIRSREGRAGRIMAKVHKIEPLQEGGLAGCRRDDACRRLLRHGRCQPVQVAKGGCVTGFPALASANG
jgi:hypothetical protein